MLFVSKVSICIHLIHTFESPSRLENRALKIEVQFEKTSGVLIDMSNELLQGIGGKGTRA